MSPIWVMTLVLWTFGTFAFGIMVAYMLRARLRHGSRREHGPTALEQILMSVCCLWFFLNLLTLFTAEIPALPSGFIRMTLLVIQLGFPGMIMQVVFEEGHRAHAVVHPRRWRTGYGLTYALAAALLAWLTYAIYWGTPAQQRWLGATFGIGTGTLFGAVAVFCIGAMNARTVEPRRESTDERSSRRSMRFLFGVMFLFVLMIFVAEFADIHIGEFMRLFGSSMPLLFIFTGLYFENRLGFVDVVLKRGIAFLFALGVVVGYFAVVFPWLEPYAQGEIGLWIRAMTLLPLVAALPLVYGKTNQLLDRWWFGRRYTAVDAIKEFLSGLQSATGEEQLIAQAQQGLGRIFRAPIRVDLDVHEAPPPGFDALLELPVLSTGERVGTIRLGRRENHVPWLAEDQELLRSLADVFSYMLENVRLQRKKQEQEQVTKELSHQASLSELKALRAQINPHFLFNALNAIAGLIHKDPLRADSTVEQLAEVFRYTLRGSEKEWARVEDELEFVRAYLDVEQARFGDRLRTSVEVTDDVKNARIPTMVVQTLVENAVKHGISGVRGQAVVEVSARRDGETVVIQVTDNGAGPETPARRPHTRAGTGFGLKSIRERFAGYYGDRAELTLERATAADRTVARIRLPFEADTGPDSAGAGSAGAA